jgi:hypothetical protein
LGKKTVAASRCAEEEGGWAIMGWSAEQTGPSKGRLQVENEDTGQRCLRAAVHV